jgi:hypothetical protein
MRKDMDKGIWATWYDLDDGDREEFLGWLHGTWLPALDADGRYNWVAHYRDQEAIASETGVAGAMPQADASENIPVGRQFLLLVGADSPHVFLDPLVLDGRDAVAVDGTAMLDRRRNVRHAIFIEEASVEGPDSPGADARTLPAPAIRLGCFNMRTPEDDFESGRWYAQNRLPHMAAAPGCVRTRKILSVAGWAKHAILYEFVSPEARRTIWNDMRATRDRDPKGFWSIGPRTVHSPGSPTLGERTWPAM